MLQCCVYLSVMYVAKQWVLTKKLSEEAKYSRKCPMENRIVMRPIMSHDH